MKKVTGSSGSDDFTLKCQKLYSRILNKVAATTFGGESTDEDEKEEEGKGESVVTTTVDNMESSGKRKYEDNKSKNGRNAKRANIAHAFVDAMDSMKNFQSTQSMMGMMKMQQEHQLLMQQQQMMFMSAMMHQFFPTYNPYNCGTMPGNTQPFPSAASTYSTFNGSPLKSSEASNEVSERDSDSPEETFPYQY